jgi:hypothetical protein
MKNEFREDSPAPSGEVKETGKTPDIAKKEKGTLSRWAETLLQMGLGESMLRVGTSVLSLVVIAAVVWLVQMFSTRRQTVRSTPPPHKDLLLRLLLRWKKSSRRLLT